MIYFFRAHQQLQLSQQLSQQTPLLMANGGVNNNSTTAAVLQHDHVVETEMKIRKLEQELRARDEVIRELELRLAEEPPAPIIPSEMDNNVEVENLLKQLEALR